MADTIKSEDASDVVRGCMAHASTPHCVTQITKTQVPKENNNPSPAGGASTGSSNKDTPMSTSATPGDEQPMDTTEVATLREDTAPPAGNSNPADVAVENKKQPTPKPEPVHQPPHSPKPAVQRPKQPSPLAHDSDGNIGGARGDNEDDDDDDEDEDEEATTTKEHTNHHVKQAGETLDQVEYKGSAYDKPMMEMHAGSNVWYQATVVHVSLNEVKAVFPGVMMGFLMNCTILVWYFAIPSCNPFTAVEDGGKDVTQWVHKASSRIWRGSLKSRDWKYLGKGAWEPRNSGVVKAGGGQRGPGVRKRRRGRPRGSGGAGAGGGMCVGGGGTRIYYAGCILHTFGILPPPQRIQARVQVRV